MQQDERIAMPASLYCIDHLAEYTAFIQREAVRRGDHERDPELRKSLGGYVELLNKAIRKLNPNYAPVHIKYVEVIKRCPECGQVVSLTE